MIVAQFKQAVRKTRPLHVVNTGANGSYFSNSGSLTTAASSSSSSSAGLNGSNVTRTSARYANSHHLIQHKPSKSIIDGLGKSSKSSPSHHHHQSSSSTSAVVDAYAFDDSVSNSPIPQINGLSTNRRGNLLVSSNSKNFRSTKPTPGGYDSPSPSINGSKRSAKKFKSDTEQHRENENSNSKVFNN